MTGEEMERAIEFLLKSQAQISARQDRTDEQIAATSRQLQNYAETQSEFIKIVTESIEGLVKAHSRTDARLDRLAAIIEQHVDDGHAHA